MTEMTYTNTQVADILSVERQTVLSWAKLFGDQLSSMANPGNGITHQYTYDDILKLTYIQQQRKRRRPVDEIKADLINGERSIPIDDLDALAFIGKPTPKNLQKRVAKLEEELGLLRTENIKLQAKNEQLQEQYTKQIESKDKEIRDLYKQLWLIEAKISS